MQTNRLATSSARKGFALIITIIFLAVVLIVFASMYSWVSSNSNITQRNNQYNMSENAAESAVERVMGQMDRDFIGGSISNSPTPYAPLAQTIDQSAWPIQYVYSDTNGATGMVSVVIAPTSSTNVNLNSEYAGLSGVAQSVDIYATATPQSQLYDVPATVHESLQFAQIPLFQFAIFYNVNLEIAPGSAMTIVGPVFCNQNIWEGSSSLTFSSTVVAHGTNAIQSSDPFANTHVTTSPSTFSLAGQPVNHANQLTMPIGTNNDPGAVLAMIQLPLSPYNMGTANAYSSNGMLYPANAADIYVTNFVWGTNDGNQMPTGSNYVAYLQDPGNSPNYLTQLPYDFYIITNGSAHTTFATNYVATGLIQGKTNIYFEGFTWLTNVAFYDWREGYNGGSGPPKRVEALQISITNLSMWLSNSNNNGGYSWDNQKLTHSGNHIASIYISDSVQLSSVQMPAVRVMNGAQLPAPGGSSRGFTVATPMPMYVWGDYNSQNAGQSALGLYGTNGATANTLPACLMADSITILSGNWNDSTTMDPAASTATTVNAAMLEGIVPTNPNIANSYSGGVENFLRLLENWGSSTLTYNGSIVVLYYSQYATNYWNGGYYGIPTRHWAFDLNFNNPAKLPPLTPDIRAMIRGNWYAHQ